MSQKFYREFRLEELPSEIRCVALDLDGTLLNSQGMLTDFTKKVLNQVISRGVHIVVSSGRPFLALPQEILNYEGIEYVIASNGVSIHHRPTNSCLHRRTMTAQSIDRIAEMAEQCSFLLETYITGCSFADARYVNHPEYYGLSPKGVRYIQNTRSPVENMQEFILLHKHELDGIRMIGTSPDEMSSLLKKIRQDSDVYITWEETRLVMELCHSECGKHHGLAWLLDYLHFTPANVISFGNAENDVDMLLFSGIGVAVSNATPACLDSADCITDSNDEDGVAKALCKFLNL